MISLRMLALSGLLLCSLGNFTFITPNDNHGYRNCLAAGLVIIAGIIYGTNNNANHVRGKSLKSLKLEHLLGSTLIILATINIYHYYTYMKTNKMPEGADYTSLLSTLVSGIQKTLK